MKRASKPMKAKKVIIDDQTEYVRVGKVEPVLGIPRQLLYRYEKANLIKLVRIKVPGCERGITLAHLPTLRALIENAGQ